VEFDAACGYGQVLDLEGNALGLRIESLSQEHGEIIAKGSIGREEIVVAEVEWDRVNEHRTHWPFLRDRRVDAYSGLEQRLLDS